MTNQLNLVIVATLAIAVTSSFAQSWLEPTFYLYTRANRGNNAPETLKYQSSSSIEASHFNGAVPTKVITHGYFDSSSRGKWMEEMAGRMLDAEDVNVIIVDWSNANRGFYPVAVANAKLVGAMVGREIELLGQTTNASAGSFHLLGHSLGGHLVSFAGKHLKGALGRITGLDPAGPSFQGRPSWDRLWPTDAQFVDVIHTDGNNLGMWETTGHLDFYPNGGVATQPGCNEERTSE
ncbi:PREDICTED: pancreatic triacylglycerol lipase-like [Rhagoletis zephyria]|uniref:pancreatic triacylglycerol lipase-like n=1 Tax=Rhagoletis zephyria TaxID=28612 RepID=UPI0008112257|nr:PREDICTED: pancreatic triacylglycerol lipase-like [Rhagoletis zephyria]